MLRFVTSIHAEENDTNKPEPSSSAWIEVTKRNIRTPSSQPSRQNHSPNFVPRDQKRPIGLRGVQPSRAVPFHLSGISLDCTPDDVIHYCRARNILVTACFFLPHRVRNVAATAKIFAQASDSAILASDPNFWPAHTRCRRWEATPPARNAPLNHSQ